MTLRHEAYFAAGCFWGVEAAFARLPGVEETEVGYTGGHTPKPNYQEICTGKTGHAECVRVVYDPKKSSFEDLLEVFWKIHDPTTPNRQGPDHGTQYRSAIFCQSPGEAKLATASKAARQTEISAPIVTEIVPLKVFHPAEAWHQKYLLRQKEAF